MLNDAATDAYLRATHEKLCYAIANAETADEESDLLEELAVIEYALFYGGFRYRSPQTDEAPEAPVTAALRRKLSERRAR